MRIVDTPGLGHQRAEILGDSLQLCPRLVELTRNGEHLGTARDRGEDCVMRAAGLEQTTRVPVRKSWASVTNSLASAEEEGSNVVRQERADRPLSEPHLERAVRRNYRLMLRVAPLSAIIRLSSAAQFTTTMIFVAKRL